MPPQNIVLVDVERHKPLRALHDGNLPEFQGHWREEMAEVRRLGLRVFTHRCELGLMTLSRKRSRRAVKYLDELVHLNVQTTGPDATHPVGVPVCFPQLG